MQLRGNGRRSGRRLARIALALLAGVIAAGGELALTMAQTVATPSVLAGIYSEEQAIRGQTLYNERCWQCHGETLAGLDQAPALVGPQFAGNWQGEPLSALVTKIDTMPPDKPGSLTRAESVDILSYVLWYNGLPASEQMLGSEQDILKKIPFELPLPDAL
jgi:quinoprotein glucose dehydrogenase